MSTSSSAQRTVQLPSGPVLVAWVYGLCVVGLVAVFAVEIAVGDKDPHRAQGPVDSITAVATFGTVALAVGAGLVLWLRRTPSSARVGALLVAALAVLTIGFFWSGAPGVLGACAAWCAGLTRGARPLVGAARAAGVVGALIAMLNVVLSVGGVVVSAFT